MHNGTNDGFTVPLRCAGGEKYPGLGWLEKLNTSPIAGCMSMDVQERSISDLTLWVQEWSKAPIWGTTGNEKRQVALKIKVKGSKVWQLRTNICFEPFTISWAPKYC